MSLARNDLASVYLIPTKLYPSRSRADLIERAQLVHRLNCGLKRKLSLVVAPAGFGKTTLLSTWLRQSSRPTAWLSLDAYDNDLALFLRYVIAAVQTTFPTASFHSLQALQAPQLPPLPHLATMLVNDLTALDHDLILVLDDYHCIVDKTIHDLLARVIDYLPPSVHLVLISRTDPPLPLARLRSQQQLTEIRAADLCFSYAETHAFLAQGLSHPPPPETVATLHTQTEGWITGLQLAMLALRGRTDEADFVRTFAGSNRHIMDYLMEEVFARQPPVVQDFLVCTAILDQFCVPLCEAVFAQDAGTRETGGEWATSDPHSLAATHTLLDYLEQANLFLVSLDDQGEWYRYHHLFQELLRRTLQARLAPDEIATLHRRASRWLAEQGWIEEAVTHALAAGDALVAAQWVERHRHALIDSEDFSALQRWLARLPAEVVQRRPALLLAKAWVANAQHQMPLMLSLAQQAEANLADAKPPLDEQVVQTLRGEIDTLRAIDCFRRGDGKQLLSVAQQALTRVAVTYGFVYGTATLGVGFGYLLTGRPQTALRFWQETLTQQTVQNDLARIRLLVALGGTQLTTGYLHQSLQTAHECLQLAAANQITYDAAWAHYVAGVIHFHWNDLAMATHHFSTLDELLHRAPVGTVIDGMLGLALIHQVQGRPAATQALMARASAVATELQLNNTLVEIRTFQARLLLLQGDIEAATRQIALVNLDTPMGVMHGFEIPRLTRARLQIAQGGQANLHAARGILQSLQPVAEGLGNVWRLAEILTLQALLYQAEGQTEQALETLAQAVQLAKPGGFIRLFVDLGPRLAPLLYQLVARGVEAEYVGQVLAVFPPTASATDPAHSIHRAAQAELVEPLTERELEVLALLARRLSNKEIALALTISPLTVRTHTSHLYQKLGVTSRKQAVDKARTLGLLPPELE